jgi:hypothetical protein
MLVRRRPIARLAAGAAIGGAAYHAGRRREQQDAYNDQAQAAYAATQPQPDYAPPQYAPPPPQYAPPPPPPVAPPPPRVGVDTEQLEKLVELHTTGALTDEEFSKAKADLLGL